MKTWNLESFGHIDEKINTLREELRALDARDDEGGLGEGEMIRRNEVASQLLLHLNKRKNNLSQKAKLSRIKEGDANSKLFHRAINRRRNRNDITGLELGGEWVEDPVRVKGQ